MLLLIFVLAASPLLLAALLSAAMLHEAGHLCLLRLFGAKIDAIRITVWGADIHLAARPALSYGREICAVAAGPTVNLLLAVLLAYGGRYGEWIYLFSGAHLLLGLFNLLPIRPLDGGTLLWLCLSWRYEPFTADRICRGVGWCCRVLLILLGTAVLLRSGSPFLLFSAAGLINADAGGKKACKISGKRVK